MRVCCDFDRASTLICGNKKPTRWNRGFYCRSYCLLNMFRAPVCPSSGAQEYYTVVAACGISCCGFSSSWSGVELRVMCPVCRMLLAQHVSGTTMPIIRSSRVLYSGCCLWYFVLWFSNCWSDVELRVCSILQTLSPKHVKQAIRSAIKTSVTSSWHFISTY